MSILLALFGAALAASLALNFLLYRRARDYFFWLHDVLLDPLDLNDYPVRGLEPPGSRPRVVFYGDSRIYDWSTPESAAFEFVNRGVSGQSSVQSAARFGVHVPPLQPDIVVIQVGINDLRTIPFFPERREEIIAHTQQSIAQIVGEARALGATVVLTTVFPFGDIPLELRPFWSDAAGDSVREVNLYLETLAGEGVIIFDAAELLANQDGRVQRAYQADHLHLNQTGYTALNEHLLPLLRKLEMD